MNLQLFLSKIKQAQRVTFAETMAVIETYFNYQPTRFSNGTGVNQLTNEAGTNEGSCKIFAFAHHQQLTVAQTLALFGDYYWQDVLENPEADNHANIRTFMNEGWKGISFYGEALTQKP